MTEIVPADAFYRAEDYHQGHYRENPIRYKLYWFDCGRDDRLEELWGGRGSVRARRLGDISGTSA